MAASTNPIDIDSLYAAKAEERTPVDTAFVVHVAPERTIAGRVSWYGPGFHGRRTANGERFDRNEMTAAHKTLPFGTLVRVVDEATGHGVLVRVNDRGPYCGGRVLDLSEAAARRLGITSRGTASARLEIQPMPTEGQGATSRITYDTNGVAIRAHGFTVRIADFTGFDEAIAMQHQMQQDGRGNIFLTASREGGKLHYTLSIGLFSSERLCASLLTDVAESYARATVTPFDKVAAVVTVGKLADTSVGTAPTRDAEHHSVAGRPASGRTRL